MPLRALVFDFDGTMLDTETPEFESWSQIYRDHQQVLSLEDWGRGIGTWGAFDPWHDLETKLGRALEQEALAVAHHERVRASIAAAELLPGVRALIEEAHAAGLKLAIASSSGRDWVHGWVERLGVLHFFAATAVKEDVLRVKPDPALYRVALERLGVSALEAVALEDSANGARAALGAGLTTVVIPNPVTRGLDFPEGARRVETLESVKLEDLRRLL